MTTSPLLTPDEVAEMLGTSTKAVIRLTHSGDLVGVDVSAGRGERARFRYTPEDVRDFILRRKAAS